MRLSPCFVNDGGLGRPSCIIIPYRVRLERTGRIPSTLCVYHDTDGQKAFHVKRHNALHLYRVFINPANRVI